MNLEVVTGIADQKMIRDSINRAAEESTLGCSEDSKHCNKNIHSDDDHLVAEKHDRIAGKERWHQEEYYTPGGKDECPQNGYFQQKKKAKGKKCYCKGDPNYEKKRRDGDGHVVENFEGPRVEEFDEEICKDQYCRIHRRNHGVPQVDDWPPMDWDHRGHGVLGRAGRNNPSPPPPWFRELPHPQPSPFGHPLSLMPPPPPPYGYPSYSMPPLNYGNRRPPFGNDYYGDFEANRGCATM